MARCMVFVDAAIWSYRNQLYCHMLADELEELHAMATKLGLKRSWFQNSASAPHYDLAPSKRALAIQLGAQEIDRNKVGELCKYWRNKRS